MHLKHLHIRGPIPYIHSLRLQDAVLEKHFAHKTLLRSNASLKSYDSGSPQPTLLTFQTYPTYTVGRRHLTANPLSQEQISFLSGSSLPHHAAGSHEVDTESEGSLATFFPSPRGGLLTYHAPGQLTAYLILNLRTHNLTPRCYIRLLENTVIRTCARHGVANVTTTEDPGVWIAEKSAQETKTLKSPTPESCVAGDTGPAMNNTTATNRKICAIGVHVSRGITSHGIGLNVYDSPIEITSNKTQLYTLPRGNIYTERQTENAMIDDGTVPAPGYLSWGFSRIVACGLEGKSVTWLSREQEANDDRNPESHRTGTTVDTAAQSLALEVTKSLKIDGAIESITEDDILTNT